MGDQKKIDALLEFEPVEPADRAAFVRDLAVEFIRRRFQNAQAIEQAKMNVLNQLMDRLHSGEQLSLDVLMELVMVLNNATNTDIASLVRLSTRGDGVNVFEGGESSNQPASPKELDANMMKLLPVLARIVEILDKEKSGGE